MATTLYLDTARLGRMSPRAQAADMAFTRLAGEVGCSARFDDLLYRGFRAWDASLQSRFRGLSDWRGICEVQKGNLIGREYYGPPPWERLGIPEKEPQPERDLGLDIDF